MAYSVDSGGSLSYTYFHLVFIFFFSCQTKVIFCLVYRIVGCYSTTCFLAVIGGSLRNQPGHKSEHGRLIPFPLCCSGESDYVFTEEVIEKTLFAEIFATGPEDLLKNRHCFCCIICQNNISMKLQGLYELKGLFQRDQNLRADQRLCSRHPPTKTRGSDGRTLYGSKLEVEKEFFMHLDINDLDHKGWVVDIERLVTLSGCVDWTFCKYCWFELGCQLDFC